MCARFEERNVMARTGGSSPAAASAGGSEECATDAEASEGIEREEVPEAHEISHGAEPLPAL